jgi:regulator of protease activity HflC (stomatin/prohibitin superfamily)
MLVPVAVAALFLLVLLSMAVRIVQEYERGIVFRLGRVLAQPKGPGLILIIPIIDRMRKVSLQVRTLNVPPQDVITRDNVTVKVNAVCYFRVQNATQAIVQVQDYELATFQIAQTTLRAVLCRVYFEEVLAERDQLNVEIHQTIDQITEPWGVKVTGLEIRDVHLPGHMERVMARQAEAERERRGKIVAAEGEFQAAQRLAEAAEVLARHPVAYQLRYLQTLSAVATRRNETLIIPFPMEFLRVGELGAPRR